MQSELIKQLIAVIVVIFILTFGFKAFAMVQDRLCEARLSTAEIDIRSDVKTSAFGSRDSKAVPIGCADKVIFVDLGRINKSFLDEYPAIRNSIEGSKANVFLLKGSRIMKAFEAGRIETPYPYFLCVKPRAGKLNLFTEGKGNATRVSADCIDDCTAAVVTAGDVEKIKTDAAAIGETETDNMANVELKRKFCRFNESFTKVEVTIKAKDNLNDVKYIEYMPKKCIDDLNKFLESFTPDYYKIKADPLIMWHFASMDENKEETITYILKIELSDYCKELISGMGIVDERNTGPYLSKTLPSITLFQYESYPPLNLDEYFKDPDNEELTYDVMHYDSDYVSAFTENRNEAKIMAQSQTGGTEIEFRATETSATNQQAPGEMSVLVIDSNVCYDPDGDGYGVCPACGTSKGCLYDGDDCSGDPDIYPGSCSAVTWSGCDVTAVGDCGVGTCTRSLPTSCLPRCDDGLQNGDETGIDCGGTCAAPACSLTQGVCAGKTKRCESSGWADCTASDYGSDYQLTETQCDTLDNDCDGQVDEGCMCTTGATQNCNDYSLCGGTQTCQAGAWSACQRLQLTCGSRDCSANNKYEIEGDNNDVSSLKTCYYYSYSACTKQCSNSGICQSCACNSYDKTEKLSVGTCKKIAECDETPVEGYFSQGTSCGGGNVCDGSGGCGPITPSCTSEVCTDGSDNDCDGLIDCADTANCPAGSSCGTGQLCAGGGCVSPQLETPTATPVRIDGINYYFNVIIKEKNGLSVTFDNVERIFLVSRNTLEDGLDWIKGKCGGTNVFSECVMNDRYFYTSTPDTYQEIWHGSVNGIAVSTQYDISTNQYS